MTPTLQILEGDWSQKAREIPDGSVQMCCTSPPYWGLRNYGVSGQLGLEKSPEEYVAKMVEVFRDVKRVLRDDGTLWLNLGDSYASGGRTEYDPDPKLPQRGGPHRSRTTAIGNLKPKDLCGIPWRVAFALQADGWYLRQWMPWIKKNPMPESTQDRPVTGCETIFLLTKAARYFYDAEAVKLPGSMALAKEVAEGYNGKASKDFTAGGAQDASAVKARIIAVKRDKQRGHSRRHDEFNDRWDEMEKDEQCNGWRSCRNSDWFFESIGGMMLDDHADPLAFVVNPQGFAGAHFATFPPNLVKPCILAGTSARGCCPKCGAPWERIMEKIAEKTYEYKTIGIPGESEQRGRRTEPCGESQFKAVGWLPTCECQELGSEIADLAGQPASPSSFDPIPCTVLDPFGGSGTTGMVALELGRNAILCELNPEYVTLARQRCAVTPGLAL